MNCKSLICYDDRLSTGRLNPYNCDTSLLISLLEYIVFTNGSDGTEFGEISCTPRPPMTMLGMGFENDLPPNKDVSERADLRRIQWIMNFMENERSKKMSNKDFQQYWDDISGVRLFLNTRTCIPYTKPFIRILNSMKNENNIFFP